MYAPDVKILLIAGVSVWIGAHIRKRPMTVNERTIVHAALSMHHAKRRLSAHTSTKPDGSCGTCVSLLNSVLAAEKSLQAAIDQYLGRELDIVYV